MLSQQENDLLCRVGPGTPMGNLMRQYWIPAVRSEELPQPDGDPVRVRLLGEDLIAFRATSGRAALVANFCPHRGAPLADARLYGHIVECDWHGWRFDVKTGDCLTTTDCPIESYKVVIEDGWIKIVV